MGRTPLFNLALIVALLTSGAAQEKSPCRGSLSDFSDSLTDLTHRVAPAVVQVIATGYISDRDEDTTFSKQQVGGSGVILTSDGYIVTNLHVVKGAKRIRVMLNSPDAVSPYAVLKDEAPQFDATLVGIHKDTDLAILKIPATALPTLDLADYSQLRQGQVVIAIGNPIGLKNAVSIGIISSIARQSEEKPLPLIQTDAAVNPGNSGGALIDTQGRLVGITSEVADGQRLGFAIPSEVVKFVFDQIRSYGKVNHGDIGVEVQNITPAIARGLNLPRTWGVIINEVKPDSPAGRAGLKPSDVVLTLGGKAVGSTPEFQELLYFMKDTERVTIEIYRKSGNVKLQVPVVYRDESDVNQTAAANDPERNFIRKLCIVAADNTKVPQDKAPGSRQRAGVLVTGKISDAESFGCELQSLDVIYSVNGRDVSDVDSLRKAIDGFASGDPVVLWIERSHKFMYVAFEVN